MTRAFVVGWSSGGPEKVQERIFLAFWPPDLSPKIIQKFSIPHLHDHMCQILLAEFGNPSVVEEDGSRVGPRVDVLDFLNLSLSFFDIIE